MSIKSILLLFNGSDEELGAVHSALALAQRFSAHVTCLHLSAPPIPYGVVYGEGMLTAAALAQSMERENTERIQQASDCFASLCQRRQIALCEPEAASGRHASASFKHMKDEAESCVAREGCFTDLIVMARAAAEKSATYDLAMTAALFNAAAPLLLVPYSKGEVGLTPIDNVMALAWNARREASRALHAGLPFLEGAEKVEIITLRQPREKIDVEADHRISGYLRLHGVSARVTLVEKADTSEGEAILAKARQLGATMLVMGAYGHSRFREMVWGGVTEYVFNHATIPLLMAH